MSLQCEIEYNLRVFIGNASRALNCQRQIIFLMRTHRKKKNSGAAMAAPLFECKFFDLLVLGDDAGNLVGGKTSVDLVANHSDRGETASTDATESVQ